MLDPKHPFAELLQRDQRYRFEAYVFVFDALRFGQQKMGLGDADDAESLDDLLDEDDDEGEDNEEVHHVTGQQLCHAIHRFAIEQYGLLAQSVLSHWGVTSTSDFGEIVFNLIDVGQMRKTDQDRREDFNDVYDFEEAFSNQVVFSPEHCPVRNDEDEADA